MTSKDGFTIKYDKPVKELKIPPILKRKTSLFSETLNLPAKLKIDSFNCFANHHHLNICHFCQNTFDFKDLYPFYLYLGNNPILHEVTCSNCYNSFKEQSNETKDLYFAIGVLNELNNPNKLQPISQALNILKKYIKTIDGEIINVI